MQLDFSPKGDPYDELVHVGWVMNEVLEPLLLAADPSGEARNPLQEGERQRQAGGACDALLSIPFQGAGAKTKLRVPGAYGDRGGEPVPGVSAHPILGTTPSCFRKSLERARSPSILPLKCPK